MKSAKLCALVDPLTWKMYTVNEEGRRIDFVFTTGRPATRLPSTEKALCPLCKTLLLLGEALEVEWDWSYVHTRWDEKRDE